MENITSLSQEKNKLVLSLLSTAFEKGISVRLEEGKVKLSAAKDVAIEQEFIALMKEHKEAIKVFLEEEKENIQSAQSIDAAITPFDRNQFEVLPVSFSQERMWFIDKYQGSTQYHIPDVLQLEGKLDRSILETVFREAVDRHEVLRTIVKEHQGIPYQQILSSDQWQMAFTNATDFQSEQLQALVQAEIDRPFNLSADYMLRARLIKQAEDNHLLIIIMHHIASDGWSVPIFINDVMELYRAKLENRPAQMSPLSIQFVDYAIWQRQWLNDEKLGEKLQYWQQQLADLPTLNLPTDFTRPAIQSTRGKRLNFTLDSDLHNRIKRVTQEEGVTLYMFLLSIYYILLFKYSRQSDIPVGSVVANRTRAEVESLVGFFINTLVMRTQVSNEDSFLDHLKKVKSTTLDAYAHQEVPFEQVVKSVGKRRAADHSPLFQVIFILQNNLPIPELVLGDLSLSRAPFDFNISKYDLTYTFQESANGLEVEIEYCTDLFGSDTVTKMWGHYQVLLQEVLNNPTKKIGQLNMLTAIEQNQLLQTFNTTYADYPKDKTVVDLIEAQALQNPDGIAIITDDRTLTYAELNAQANQLAHYLKATYSIETNDRIGTLLNRSSWLIIAQLAILKSGGAYVPIDKAYPVERITFMAQDASLKCLIILSEDLFEVMELGIPLFAIDMQMDALNAEGFPTDRLPNLPQPKDLAYVIYTSGSTGQPKGVMVTHQSLSNLVNWHIQAYDLSSQSKSTMLAGVGFDASAWEVWPYLSTGSSIHIVASYFQFSAENVINFYRQHAITHSFLPTVLAPDFIRLSQGQQLPLQYLLTGGDTLQDIEIAQLDYRLFNNYGPTENTVVATFCEIKTKAHAEKPPIGKPISNTQIYILDEQLQVVPEGLSGEIFIAGDSLAIGYLDRPDLTAEKFISNPYADGKGKMYRTGDLARWLPNGDIDFVGRKEGQVQIRGIRIELGEVEVAIQALPQVAKAIVLTKAGADGMDHLLAFIQPIGKFDKVKIKDALSKSLPEYMIPAVLIKLETIPQTPNGKIDTQALLKMSAINLLADQFVEAKSEIEKKLVEIWKELLGVEQVGIQDNFFELGGHSLLAVRVATAIKESFAVELATGDLFSYSTIAALARHIDTLEKGITLPPIVAEQRPDQLPLSFSQERLWFIHKLHGSTHYHVPIVLHLNGEIKPSTLELAFQQIIHRHEVLRTVFKEEKGRAYQQILTQPDWQMEYIDHSTSSTISSDQLIAERINQPFNLEEEPLFRACLIKVAEHTHLLVLVFHHIASDGWSFPIFAQELSELYSAQESRRPVNLPELEVQYADYALWQQKYLEGPILDQQLDYWVKQLEGVQTLDLPIDYQRPALQSIRGSRLSFDIEASLYQKLERLKTEEEVTLFMLLLAAFKVLLFRYSGQTDICVGSPVANRAHKAIEPLIGFFVNMLPLRSDLSHQPEFRHFLAEVKKTTLQAFNHQAVPLEKIVDQLGKFRDTSRSPVFQVMFVLQNNLPVRNLKLGQAQVSEAPFRYDYAKYELVFVATETADGLRVEIEYCSDLFVVETIEQMRDHYIQLLSSIAANPTQSIMELKLINHQETSMLMNDFNNTAYNHPTQKTMVDLFEEQVLSSPQAVALRLGDQEMSYTELNAAANRLARYLRKKGVADESLVGICLDRSFSMIIAVLGILKAGGAYVPIDQSYPESRITYIVEDAQIRYIISDTPDVLPTQLQERVCFIDPIGEQGQIDQESVTNLSLGLRPSQLAYIIYTSGSTGQPKGVMIEHASNVNMSLCQIRRFGILPEDRVIQFASLSFDASVSEIFMALYSGASLLLVNEAFINQQDDFVSYLKEQKVSVVTLPPAFLHSLDRQQLSFLRVMISAGEAAFVKDALECAEFCNYFNAYGPTEYAVCISTYELMKENANQLQIPIGQPIDNTQVYILDTNQNLQPIGIPGELYVSGPGLARGYLNQPELTKEKFIDNPFRKDHKMYRTGDIAKWRSDGNIDFIGRADDQLKIRGYRIEPSEIEQALQELDQVKHAVVVAREDASGSKRLVAYIVSESALDQAELFAYLKTRLPLYMIPSLLLKIDQLPLTSSGKVDKKALPQADMTTMISATYVAPADEEEQLLAQIWQEILGLEKVGVEDNFFELGGHSLLATRVASAIHDQFSFDIKIKILFQFTTIRELARYIRVSNESKTFDESEFEVFDL